MIDGFGYSFDQRTNERTGFLFYAMGVTNFQEGYAREIDNFMF